MIQTELKEYLDEDDLKLFHKISQRQLEEKERYPYFLAYVSKEAHIRFFSCHEKNTETKKLWGVVANNIRNTFSRQKYLNQDFSFVKGVRKERVPLQTEKFQNYEHVMYLGVNEVMNQIRYFFKETALDLPLYAKKTIDISGYQINVGNSLKFLTFLEHGSECACCNLQGKFFSISRLNKKTKSDKYQLCLWGAKGKNLVLFTHDHIKNRASGGTNHISNTTTMCFDCNNFKSKKETEVALLVKQAHRPLSIKKLKMF